MGSDSMGKQSSVHHFHHHEPVHVCEVVFTKVNLNSYREIQRMLYIRKTCIRDLTCGRLLSVVITFVQW
jgi:hypothetical protein